MFADVMQVFAFKNEPLMKKKKIMCANIILDHFVINARTLKIQYFLFLIIHFISTVNKKFAFHPLKSDLYTSGLKVFFFQGWEKKQSW